MDSDEPTINFQHFRTGHPHLMLPQEPFISVSSPPIRSVVVRYGEEPKVEKQRLAVAYHLPSRRTNIILLLSTGRPVLLCGFVLSLVALVATGSNERHRQPWHAGDGEGVPARHLALWPIHV